MNFSTRSTMVFDMAESYEEWWLVVKALAHYYASGLNDDQLLADATRVDLKLCGFSDESIQKAFTWLEKTQLTLPLSEVFSFLEPDQLSMRVRNPLEHLGISERFWRIIQQARDRGLMSSWQAEQLLEGARMLDTRDWDAAEVETLMIDFLTESGAVLSRTDAARLLSADYRDYLS